MQLRTLELNEIRKRTLSLWKFEYKKALYTDDKSIKKGRQEKQRLQPNLFSLLYIIVGIGQISEHHLNYDVIYSDIVLKPQMSSQH